MYKKSIAKLSGCLILLCTVVTANAQFRVFKSIDEIEVLAGLSSVTFGGEDWESNKIKIGYSAGLGASWKLKERSSLSVRLLSERKGIKFLFETTFFDENMQSHKGKVTSSTNLDYLTMPIIFRHNIDKHSRLFVEAGFYFSWLYKAQTIEEFSWTSKDVYNRKDAFTQFDSGLNLLLGYKLSINDNLYVKFWANASYGLVKIGEESGATGFLNVHNEVLGMGMSIVRNLDKENTP